MRFPILENVLWGAGFAANLALLAVLLIKKRARQFPIFTAYVGYEIAETVILVFVSAGGNQHIYFRAYWGLALGDYVLQLAIIYEIAREVLRPTGTWIRDARTMFFMWSALGALIAAGMSSSFSPPGRLGIELWAERSSLFTSILTCEVFLAMSVSANRLGLPWGSHVMALGEGLTFWAAIALASDVANLATDWRKDLSAFDIARTVAYLSATIFWSIKFALPQQERLPLSPEMREYLIALHKQVLYDLSTIRPKDKSTL